MIKETAFSSWAVPTDQDDREWDSLTREQQLAAYKARFMSADCTTSTDVAIDEIADRVRAAVLDRQPAEA